MNSSTSATLPLAISLGDPAGVGPEVMAKVLAKDLAKDLASSAPAAMPPLILLGSQDALHRAADRCGVVVPPLRGVTAEQQQALLAGNPLGGGESVSESPVWMWDLGPLAADFAYGRVQAACGHLAVQAVELAAQLCLAGSAAAMVTCPINKEAIHAAGYVDDIGHQEILARLTKAEWTATMLMTPGLKVVHLSTHKSLGEAVRYVQHEVVLDKLKLTHNTLREWGMPEPKIAVAGLNPHNGEGGLLGAEELEQIGPAVADAQVLGIQAVGPIPADSVFNRAINGEFDVVLAMYHDQGHIAIKVHDFHHSTTATLGIPLVRTSVDHGTAFDIAGTGVADATGLQAAIEAANRIVRGELSQL